MVDICCSGLLKPEKGILTVSSLKGGTRTPHVSCVLCIQYASLYEAVQQVCAGPRQNPDLRAYDHVELLTETDDVPVANASICPSFFL